MILKGKSKAPALGGWARWRVGNRAPGPGNAPPEPSLRRVFLGGGENRWRPRLCDEPCHYTRGGCFEGKKSSSDRKKWVRVSNFFRRFPFQINSVEWQGWIGGDAAKKNTTPTSQLTKSISGRGFCVLYWIITMNISTFLVFRLPYVHTNNTPLWN